MGAVTWHATHCCPGCATTGRHGPGCEGKQFASSGKENRSESISDDAQPEVEKPRSSWSSRLLFHPLWQRVRMKREDVGVQDSQTEPRRMSEAPQVATEIGSTLKTGEDHHTKENCAKPLGFDADGNAKTKPAETAEEQEEEARLKKEEEEEEARFIQMKEDEEARKQAAAQ